MPLARLLPTVSEMRLSCADHAKASTPAQCLDILSKLNLHDSVPANVVSALQSESSVSRTTSSNVHNFLVGSNAIALAAAQAKAQSLGYTCHLLGSTMSGLAHDAANWFCDHIKQAGTGRHCYLAGGETTVVVNGTGKGGRNQVMSMLGLHSSICRSSPCMYRASLLEEKIVSCSVLVLMGR